MRNNHRREYHRAWDRLTPPLRPHPDVVKAVKDQIRDRSGLALLLGVTPEFADIAPHLVAVDRNASMIASVWPGNSATRCAIVGDWCNANFVSGAFSLCIGDGSLCALEFPDETAKLFHQLTRIIESRGRIVCRLYLSPDSAETVSSLRREAMAGAVGNFHAFKMRLAMALAARQPRPQIGVAAILDTFNMLFEDRDELVSVTGWRREHIDTIDFYRGSAATFNLPTKDQLFSVVSSIVPAARLVPSGNYEMAERCPLLVAEIP